MRELDAALAAAGPDELPGAARVPGAGADERGDRGAVGRSPRRGTAAPRGRARPYAPDLTAVHRGRLPRAPRHRGAAHGAAAAARARAERAGARDRRGARLDEPVDDHRRVRDGRHGARADGALRRGRAPSRPRGGGAARRQPTRGPRCCCTTHAACCASAKAASRRPSTSLRARSAWKDCSPAARPAGRRAQPGAPGARADGRHGPVREALAGSSPDERDRAGMRIALGGAGARGGRPRTGGRGAGAGDRRLVAGAVRALGARRGAAARRDRARPSRRPARGGGVARGGARARRARRR